MNNGLSGIKNIIWALGIVIVLLALVVGLVFAVSNKYYGEQEDGTLVLGGERPAAESGAEAEVLPGMGPASGSLNELISTQDAGLEYLFGLTFLCDSTVSGLGDYSSSVGSGTSVQLWTDTGSGFPAASASDTAILYPADGSLIVPSNAAMVYQPKRLVIYIGGDDLASATEDSFISGYKKLIQGIQANSADTTVICCSIASVSAAYPGVDGLTAELTAQANQWIRTVCTDTGVYFADLASVLNDGSGYLAAEYASGDGRSLSSAGINKVMDYLRMHAV